MAKALIRHFEKEIRLEHFARRSQRRSWVYRRLCTDPYTQIAPGTTDRRVIFIHIPKAGGSSLRRALFGTMIGPHRTLRAYHLFDPVRYRQSLRMGVLRDPRSRFLSACTYLIKGGRNHQDRRFAERILKDINSAEGLLDQIETSPQARRAILRWRHFCPQSEFVCLQGKRIDLTHPLCFETLEEDLNRIEPDLVRNGLDPVQWTQKQPRHPAESIPEDLGKRILQIYATDWHLYCQCFGNP